MGERPVTPAFVRALLVRESSSRGVAQHATVLLFKRGKRYDVRRCLVTRRDSSVAEIVERGTRRANRTGQYIHREIELRRLATCGESVRRAVRPSYASDSRP